MCDITPKYLQAAFLTDENLQRDCYFPRYSVTDFYVIETDEYRSKIVRKIPFGLIEKICRCKATCFYLVSKVGIKIKLRFPTEDNCNKMMKEITEMIALSKLICESDDFPHVLLSRTNEMKMTEVDSYYSLLSEEFTRLQFNSEKWEITKINNNFKLSPTYPKFHIVLKHVSNEALEKICHFRSQQRFPTVTYRSKATGAVLLRSGQPLIGANGTRCVEDENYLKRIMAVSQSSSKKNMVIFDARSEEAARLYFAKGGGTENTDNYSMVEHRFLSIPNMVIILNYFEIWREMIFKTESESVLKQTDWIFYISKILEAMEQISTLLCEDGRHVLIHCSNGWYRTPQFTATSKLIMDPFYRTNEGFKILVEQEWRQLGHKFGERCAIGPYSITRQYSPIFLQWLDCVHQLLCQFPEQFEFNQTFLIKLAIHLYSGTFGNFNRNFMKERCENQSPIVDIWSYLFSTNTNDLRNCDYFPTIEILKPKYSIDDIDIWRELYEHDLENY